MLPMDRGAVLAVYSAGVLEQVFKSAPRSTERNVSYSTNLIIMVMRLASKAKADGRELHTVPSRPYIHIVNSF